MKTKRKLSLIAATVVAFAFTTPDDISEGKENNYPIDIKSTTATWIGKKVIGQHTGGVSISKGNLISDGKNITGGVFEFNMNSITNTDIIDKEYHDKLIGHLKSDDFFSVEKNPTAKFEITKITLKSGNDFDVEGKLRIKGITNTITFPALVKVDEKTIVIVAKITVNRTKFEIKYGSATFFDSLGDKAISDEFELNVNLVAKLP